MLGVSCVRIRLNCRRLFTKTTAAAPCQQLIKYLVRARALCLSRMLGIATRLSCTCCIRLCPSRASEPAAPHLGRDQGDAHCSRTCPFQRVKCWSLRCTLSLTHRLHRLAALLPSINRYRYQNTTLSFLLACSLSLSLCRTHTFGMQLFVVRSRCLTVGGDGCTCVCRSTCTCTFILYSSCAFSTAPSSSSPSSPLLRTLQEWVSVSKERSARPHQAPSLGY